MEKRWPVLAQILIALGCGGGMISMYAGFAQKNWLIVALGVFMAIVFWYFYQFHSWAQKVVTALMITMLVMDIFSVVAGLIEWLPGVLAVIFRGLLVYYFNSKEINTLFEKSSNPT